MNIVVRNDHTRELENATTEIAHVDRGDRVVFESRYGRDIGSVVLTDAVRPGGKNRERRTVYRVALSDDIDRYERLDQEARDAEALCRDRIGDHGLKMQLVTAHYLLDRSKLLFFFTADQRVDFRRLVRDLVSYFHMRVELRQIGVRDETRMLGGVGVCGRTLCCNSVSDRLAPVSIRMAKNQNYSLNSMKASGPCGRLLCCLAYENHFYESERKRYPKEGNSVRFDDARYKVHEVNVLTRSVKMGSDAGHHVTLPICAFSHTPEGWVADFTGCPGADSRTEVDTT